MVDRIGCMPLDYYKPYDKSCNKEIVAYNNLSGLQTDYLFQRGVVQKRSRGVCISGILKAKSCWSFSKFGTLF